MLQKMKPAAFAARPASGTVHPDGREDNAGKKSRQVVRATLIGSGAQSCVWITREGPAWLVIAREHGWLHGSYCDALEDARWLSKNLDLPIRRAAITTRLIDDELAGAAS
jgi:hypothetical protein